MAGRSHVAARLSAGFLPRRLPGQHGGPVGDRRQRRRAVPARGQSVQEDLEVGQELRLQAGAVLDAGLDRESLPEGSQADCVLDELYAAIACCKTGVAGGQRPAGPVSGQGVGDSPGSPWWVRAAG